MVREFKLPDVGEGVAEGELLEWHVAVGDRVTEDQVVAEVETDKAVVDVPAPVNGTVSELRADPGDVVPVGDVIITFDVDGGDDSAGAAAGESDAAADAAEDGTGTSESDQTAASAASGRVFAAPSARRLARELDVDIDAVEGSGPGGRVTESDVRAAAESGGTNDADDSDDGKQLKSAVSRIGEDEDEDDGTQLKSAVSRIDDGESGVESKSGGGPATGAASGSDAGAASGSDAGAASGSDAGAPVESADRERTLAAPATRRVADELDVALDHVPTDETRDGEAYVSEAAVREYAEAQQEAQAADAAAVSAGSADAAASSETPTAGERETREPYRGVRKTIGEAMERSAYTAPHVTHHDTVDASALVDAREKLKSRAEDRGVNLTYLPFVMKAVVAALKEHPVLNTSLDEANDEIVYKHYYDIGVATATDAGLMVPVVESVDEKGLLEIADDVTELSAKARDRSIDREELRGSTFSVTNFGAIGGEYATPIINYPETAILGLGEIKERPMVVDGEVVPRDVMTISLSVDHRVVDGADAARFANTLTEYLEDPTLLLLE